MFISPLQPKQGEKGGCGGTHPWPLTTFMYGVSEGQDGFAGAVVCHPAKRFGGCVTEQQCVLQREESRVPGACQHLLRRSKVASEHSIAPEALAVPSKHCGGCGRSSRRPRCFYYWENKRASEDTRNTSLLCMSSSWSLRGNRGSNTLREPRF